MMEEIMHSNSSVRSDDEVNRVGRTGSDYSMCQMGQTCPKRSVLFFREHTFLRGDPAMTTCPNCLCGIETVVKRRNTIKTHLSALMLFPICLCILPYYSKVLRDTLHSCPSCGIHLGSNFSSMRKACLICSEEQ